MKNIILILFLILYNIVSFSQMRNHKRHHAFSGTLVLAVEGGATYGRTDYRDFIVDYAGRGMLEYFFPTRSSSSFGLRIFGGGGYLTGKDKNRLPDEFRTDLIFYGGQLVYNLSLGDVVFPYLAAGGSYLYFNPQNTGNIKLPNNAAGIYKTNAFNINGELGFRFLLSRDLSLNFSAGAFINPNDNLDDDFNTPGRSNDLFFTGMAGLSFSFFGTSDLDRDGIYDGDDKCEDEPEDMDGYMDKDGCPDLDDDGDQIVDINDDCLNQIEDFDGFKDEDGCPELDNDEDGLLDADDLCANQPEDFDGFEDFDGCPEPDNDKDGILDRDDKCPNEAENRNSFEDEDGCIDEKPQPKVEAPREIILSAGTNFAVGKSELNQSAYSQLDTIVEIIRENPNTRWRIEGHTDSKGSDKANKKLSLARANSVFQYFLSKGLDSNRFDVVGLGKDVPIADNSTEMGRAKNRRVVILRLN